MRISSLTGTRQALSWLLMAVGISWTTWAEATPIITHSGNTDPTLETPAWGSSPGGAAVGPVNISPLAWFVNDTTSGVSYDYRISPTVTQEADAALLGWELKTNLRVPNANDPIDGAVTVMYRSDDLGRDFRMAFGTTSGGDPMVMLVDSILGVSPFTYTGTTYTLTGAGNTYNEFKLVYSPGGGGTADLFVNGVEQISNWSGRVTGGGPLVLFGSPSANGIGRGDYNYVSFTIVPEPSSSALMLAATAIGLVTARRKKFLA